MYLKTLLNTKSTTKNNYYKTDENYTKQILLAWKILRPYYETKLNTWLEILPYHWICIEYRKKTKLLTKCSLKTTDTKYKIKTVSQIRICIGLITAMFNRYLDAMVSYVHSGAWQGTAEGWDPCGIPHERRDACAVRTNRKSQLTSKVTVSDLCGIPLHGMVISVKEDPEEKSI